MGESVKSYTRLRRPEIRLAVFENFARGTKRASIGIERSKSPWNTELKRQRNSRHVTSASQSRYQALRLNSQSSENASNDRAQFRFFSEDRKEGDLQTCKFASSKEKIVLTKNKKHLKLLSTKNKMSVQKLSLTNDIKSTTQGSPRDDLIYVDGDSTAGVLAGAVTTQSAQKPRDVHYSSDQHIPSMHFVYPVTQEGTPKVS